MNKTLNINRFGKYFVSDLKGDIASFGPSMILLSSLGAITWLFINTLMFFITGDWGFYSPVVRFTELATILVATLIVSPIRCYGKVTERRAGSNFLMLPASSFEKTASAILTSCIVIPAMVVAATLGIDALICALDPTVSGSMLSCINLDNLMATLENDGNAPIETIKNILSPILYVDDLIQIGLIFLLGALCFRSNKFVKTVGVMIALQMVCSLISTPLVFSWSKSLVDDAEMISILFEKLGWIFNHIVLVDTINDTIVNLLLAGACWYRIRTIKH